MAPSIQVAARAGCGVQTGSNNTMRIPSFCEQNKGEAASYTPLARGAAGLKLRDEATSGSELAVPEM